MKHHNLAYFISRRISVGKNFGFTGVIIKIAVATIALSVAVMILSSSIIQGFKNQITDKIFGFWGHIHITDANVNRNFELLPIADAKALKDSILSIDHIEYHDLKSNQKLRTAGGVDHIQSFIISPGIIKTKTSLEGIILKGIGKDYRWDKLEPQIKSGRILNLQDSTNRRGILLSQQTARRLELKVDDKVILNFVKDRNHIQKPFFVDGIYRTGLEEYDKKFAFVDQSILRTILAWDEDQIGGYEVILEDFNDAAVMADFIYEDILPSNLYAETIKEKFPNIFEWLDLTNINEKIIIMLMIIVSIINMATALLILILERSTMIGILKTLGETDWNIRKIFLYHAANIILFGLLIGNILGIGIAVLQKHFGFIKLDEENYYLSIAPVELDFFNIFLINIGTILITLIFLVVPSYMVTKINIIKVLRFD